MPAQKKVVAVKIEAVGEAFAMSLNGAKNIAVRVKTDRDIEGLGMTPEVAQALILSLTKALTSEPTSIGFTVGPGNRTPN